MTYKCNNAIQSAKHFVGNALVRLVVNASLKRWTD
jgi:hypothetical protein